MGLWSNVISFVQAVVVHVVTILAGCAATVALELFRRFKLKGRDFPDRWYLWVLSSFLAFATFQAWQDQYLSNVARREDVNKRDGLLASVSSDKRQCDFELGVMRSVNAQEISRLATQQESVNACVIALAKEAKPEALNIRSWVGAVPGVESRTPDGHRLLVSVIVSIANKTLTPVRTEVACRTPFTILAAAIAGERWQITAGVDVLSDRKAVAKIDSPAWVSGRPLIITLTSQDAIPDSCSVRQE